MQPIASAISERCVRAVNNNNNVVNAAPGSQTTIVNNNVDNCYYGAVLAAFSHCHPKLHAYSLASWAFQNARLLMWQPSKAHKTWVPVLDGATPCCLREVDPPQVFIGC